MSTSLINEQTHFAKQPNNFSKVDKPTNVDLVGDIKLVDKTLEEKRKHIWNQNGQLLTFGKYYKDEIVSPPFALYFKLQINNDENLCLKITTTLRDCWGYKCHALLHTARHTPYLFWIENSKYLHYPIRICFECMSPIQREMLRLIYES